MQFLGPKGLFYTFLEALYWPLNNRVAKLESPQALEDYFDFRLMPNQGVKNWYYDVLCSVGVQEGIVREHSFSILSPWSGSSCPLGKERGPPGHDGRALVSHSWRMEPATGNWQAQG